MASFIFPGAASPSPGCLVKPFFYSANLKDRDLGGMGEVGRRS